MDLEKAYKDLPLFQKVVNNIMKKKYTIQNDRIKNSYKKAKGKVIFEKFLGKDFYPSPSLGFLVFLVGLLFLYVASYKDVSVWRILIFGGFFLFTIIGFISEGIKKIHMNITVIDYLEELKNIFLNRIWGFEKLFEKGSRYYSIASRKNRGERLLTRLEIDKVLNADKIKEVQGLLYYKIEPAYESISEVKQSVDLFLEKLRKTVDLINKKIERYNLVVDYNSFVKDVNDNVEKDLQRFFDEIFAELSLLPKLEEDVKAIHCKFIKGLKEGDRELDELSDFYVRIEEEFSFTRDLIKA